MYLCTQNLREQRIMANEIVLYKPNEQFQLEVQVMDETVWLTQQQMAQLFGVAENNITYHIRGIYKTQELEPTATAQKIRVVRQEGNRTVARSIDFYNLDMIISVGYRVNAQNFNAEHERCLAFIRQAVADSCAKTKIVLTHHVPTQLCTAPEFKGSTINGTFTVELGNYIADSGIDYWIYGHSHRNIDAKIGNTQILSNQFGYLSHGEPQQNGFDPKRCITII